MRKVAVLILTVVLALILIVTGVGCPVPPGKEVTVGNKDFTEQYIIGQMIKQLLEDRGFRVELKSGHTSMYLREAMEFGDIDIVAEYTGTGWMVHLLHQYEPGTDNNELYRVLKDEDEGNGLIWLNPVWNNNTYALASWPEFVEEHELATLSDLAALYREKEGAIRIFVGWEFAMRPDDLPALERHYDFKVAEPFLMTEPPGASQRSLAEHKVDVAMVFGTDAAIAEYGWHVYMDDKDFFPPYDLTPYVRQEVLDNYPEIADILNELVATFPGGGEDATLEIVAEGQEVWQELNAKVDIDGMKAHQVACDYLVAHGLIKW